MKLYNVLILLASVFFTMQVFAAASDLYTYNDDILPLFQDQGCTDCHSWTGNYSELIVKTSESTSPAGTPVVKPNDASGSVLVWRLKGETSTGTTVSLMPLGRDPLSEEAILRAVKWIDAGAPEIAVTVKVTTWGKLKSLFR